MLVMLKPALDPRHQSLHGDREQPQETEGDQQSRANNRLRRSHQRWKGIDQHLTVEVRQEIHRSAGLGVESIRIASEEIMPFGADAQFRVGEH